MLKDNLSFTNLQFIAYVYSLFDQFGNIRFSFLELWSVFFPLLVYFLWSCILRILSFSNDSCLDLYYLHWFTFISFLCNVDTIPQTVRRRKRKGLHSFSRNGGNGTGQKKPRISQPGSIPGWVSRNHVQIEVNWKAAWSLLLHVMCSKSFLLIKVRKIMGVFW